MTPDEYLERSASIHRREQILRNQIDGHIVDGRQSTDSALLRPLVERHQQVLDELADLDKEFLDNG